MTLKSKKPPAHSRVMPSLARSNIRRRQSTVGAADDVDEGSDHQEHMNVTAEPQAASSTGSFNIIC